MTQSQQNGQQQLSGDGSHQSDGTTNHTSGNVQHTGPTHIQVLFFIHSHLLMCVFIYVCLFIWIVNIR